MEVATGHFPLPPVGKEPRYLLESASTQIIDAVRGQPQLDELRLHQPGQIDMRAAGRPLHDNHWVIAGCANFLGHVRADLEGTDPDVRADTGNEVRCLACANEELTHARGNDATRQAAPARMDGGYCPTVLVPDQNRNAICCPDATRDRSTEGQHSVGPGGPGMLSLLTRLDRYGLVPVHLRDPEELFLLQPQPSRSPVQIHLDVLRSIADVQSEVE